MSVLPCCARAAAFAMCARADVASRTMSISPKCGIDINPSTPSWVVGIFRRGARRRQWVGVGVDADQPRHFQVFGRPQDLEHQVGADVAGADDGHLGLGHGMSFGEKVAETPPSGVILARIWVPGGAGAIGPSAPERMTWPARSGSPYCSAVRASQARALRGSPRQALPVPSETR